MDRRRPGRGQRGDAAPRADPAWAAAQQTTLIATERDEAARTAWRAEMAPVAAGTLVLLDEPSPHTVMTRTHGRAPRGERVVGRVPRKHGPNVTCLAALTATGVIAPLVIEGAVDGSVFLPWPRDWLLPSLAPGTTAVLDTLSVHRNPDVRSAVAGAGLNLRSLPPYSPDVNPVDLAFRKLKTHLRGVAARSCEPLRAAIGTGLNQITPADIRE